MRIRTVICCVCFAGGIATGVLLLPHRRTPALVGQPASSNADRTIVGLTPPPERDGSGFRTDDLEQALASVAALPEKERSARAYEIIAQWADHDPAAAAKRLLSLAAGKDRPSAISRVAAAWAVQDPSAALAWSLTLGEKDRESALRPVMRELAQADPEEAAKVYASLPPTEAGNAARHYHSEGDGGEGNIIASEWVRVDPAAAVRWVRTLSGRERELAERSIIRTWSESDPRAAADYSLGIPAEKRAESIAAVLENWFQTDVDAAVTWVAQIPDSTVRDAAIEAASSLSHQDGFIDLVALMSPGRNQDRALEKAARDWASSDHESAVAWARQQTDSHVLDVVWPSISGAIVARDREAAKELAEEMPTTARDKAIRQIVRDWAEEDKGAAADYALRISDPESRRAGVGDILAKWLHTDYEAARRWTQALPSARHATARSRGHSPPSSTRTRVLLKAGSVSSVMTRSASGIWSVLGAFGWRTIPPAHAPGFGLHRYRRKQKPACFLRKESDRT